MALEEANETAALRTVRSSACKEILIVGGDRIFASEIEKHGYEVQFATSRDAALSNKGNEFCIVIDVNSDEYDGIELLRELRESTDAVIIATGAADDVDEIVALEVGADDYLSKPLFIKKFLAHMRANARRYQSRQKARVKDCESCSKYDIVQQSPLNRTVNYVSAGLAFESRGFNLQAKDGSPIALSAQEFALFQLLIGQKKVSLDEIFKKILKVQQVGDTINARALVSRLRRKLEEHTKARVIRSDREGGLLLGGPHNRSARF